MHVIAANWIERLGCLAVCAGLALLPALAQASEEDPWQGYNRFMFRINDNVDAYTLKPLAKGYQAVTPQLLEDGVHNIFRNIGDVGNLANNVLQGKLHDAGVDSGRLIFNTTFGLLGFFDVATHMGLQRSDEDFGQTLGAWGLGSGPYVVLPLLGPSTFRDAPARFVDAPLDPLYHYDDVRVRNSLLVVNVVNTRARLLPATDLVERIALDQYAFVRDAYLKRRASLIRDGAPDPTEQTYEDYDEEESRSEAPQAFPPFKAALLQSDRVQERADTLIPDDLQQSERAKSELGLMN